MRAAFLTTAIVILVATAAAVAAPEVRVIVDGDTLHFDQPPILMSGRVLVPLRGVFERLGATVDWSSVTQAVRAATPRTLVELRPGHRTALLNGRPVSLDASPLILNSRILVPLRFVSEALGTAVQWDAATSTVRIFSKPTAAGVSVTVGAGTFRVGQNISATVSNNLNRSIFTGDSKTDCSIVVVERWTGQRWEPVLGCQLRTPPGIVEIPADTRVSVTLHPMSVHLTSGTAGRTALGPGTYRLKFTHGTTPGDESLVVFSEEFQIQR